MAQESSVQARLLAYDTQTQRSGSPTSPALRQMGVFSQDIIVEADGCIERRATNSLVALALHAGVIAVLAALSVLSPIPVRLSPWTHVILTVPAAALKARVVPAGRRSPPLSSEHALPPVQLTPPVFSAPLNPSEPPPPLEAFRTESSASTSGIGNVLGGIPSNLPAPSVSPVVSQRLRFVHQGGDVKSTHPIRELIVAYPEFARMARVVGRVIIQAIIDEKGKVINARAISGPPLLYLAALDAVSRERFEPMLLNDEPVKCDLKVQVSFKLDDPPF
jgi:TonB family protein